MEQLPLLSVHLLHVINKKLSLLKTKQKLRLKAFVKSLHKVMLTWETKSFEHDSWPLLSYGDRNLHCEEPCSGVLLLSDISPNNFLLNSCIHLFHHPVPSLKKVHVLFILRTLKSIQNLPHTKAVLPDHFCF